MRRNNQRLYVTGVVTIVWLGFHGVSSQGYVPEGIIVPVGKISFSCNRIKRQGGLKTTQLNSKFSITFYRNRQKCYIILRESLLNTFLFKWLH